MNLGSEFLGIFGTSGEVETTHPSEMFHDRVTIRTRFGDTEDNNAGIHLDRFFGFRLPREPESGGAK
jgi:hypothetical protein